MNDLKKDHPRLEDPNHVHHPYWRHAHRDWRVWVGVTLMLAIMLLYVRRGAFGWPMRVQSPQTVSGPAVK
jgi:hypothetical protein